MRNLAIRLSITLAVLLVAFQGVVYRAQAFPPEIPSEKEFRKETREHRMRVLDFAVQAVERFPKRFPKLHTLSKDIRVHLVETYMSLHDLPKMMSREQLEKFGYTNDRSLLQRLRPVYGVNAKPEAVDELNNIEKIIKAYIMEKKLKEFPDHVAAHWDDIMVEIQLAERAADVADTKNFRTRELAFKWRRGAAREFLMSRGETAAADIAHWIQESQIQDPTLRLCRHLLAVKPTGPEVQIAK